MTPGLVTLSPTEVRRVAAAARHVVNGEPLAAGARALKISRDTLGQLLKLPAPAALRVTPATLSAIAAAVNATTEQLLAGDVVLPEASPAAGSGPGRVIVRRSRRR